MSRSTVEPDWYWLRKIEGVTAYIRLHGNVKQIQVEDNGEPHTEYEYDEKEIGIMIPEDIITEGDVAVRNYIKNKRSTLIEENT